MLVVAYHAFPAWVRGGFIGVDIFFVISGFLISGVLFDSLSRGTFGARELRDFYARRVKRIFPALCLVLATCYIVGWFILTPTEYLQLAKEILAGATFVSNFYFWQQTGYFDGGADTKPLLHLWSLAIEEQFYLLWPLILVGIRRLRFKPVAIVAVLCAASFAAGILLIGSDRTAAFYSPPARFWELMIGGLLACLSRSNPITEARHRNHDARALLGLLLLLAALALTTDLSPFPGWFAVPPVFAAALLISARGSWFNRHVLGCAPMRAIGLISYPMYLWHWPVLYLVRYFDLFRSADEDAARWAAITLSVVLSAATYLAVERPVRFGSLRRYATAPLAASMLAMVFVGVVTVRSDGFSARDSGEMARLARFAGKYPATEWRDRICFLSPADGPEKFATVCDGSGKTRPLVVLWGDSYAAALYPGLKALEEKGAFRLAQYTASACPPLLGTQFPAQHHCKAINDMVIGKIAHERPDTVVLTARWSYRQVEPAYEFSQLARTTAELKRAGVRQVVVIGPTPQWDKPMPSMLGSCAGQQTLREGGWHSRCGLVPEVDVLDRSMRDFSATLGVSYLSAYEAMCTGDGCLTVLDDGAVSTYDLGHLSPPASRLLIEKLAGRIF